MSCDFSHIDDMNLHKSNLHCQEETVIGALNHKQDICEKKLSFLFGFSAADACRTNTTLRKKMGRT
jgi:hypothetical protein